MFTINLKNKDLERSPAIRDCIEQAKRSGIIALTSSVTAPDELSALLATIRFSVIETQWIITCSSSHHQIHEVNLTGVNLTDMFDILSAAISASKTLTKLSIVNCPIGMTSQILETMKIHNSSVRHLDFSQNRLNDCGPELAKFLKGIFTTFITVICLT